MSPEKRKELLMHEANNPDSRYLNNSYTGKCIVTISQVLANPDLDWEIYVKPKPDIVDYVNLYNYYRHKTLGKALADKSNGYVGTIKCTRDRVTGKIKSVEVLK